MTMKHIIASKAKVINVDSVWCDDASMWANMSATGVCGALKEGKRYVFLCEPLLGFKADAVGRYAHTGEIVYAYMIC